MLQAYRGTAQASRSQQGPASKSGERDLCYFSGCEALPLLCSSLQLPATVLSSAWYVAPVSLLVPLSPRRPDSCLRSFLAFPSVPVRVPVSAVWARKLGADFRRRSPVSVLVFLCSLAQPPVALTWAPQGALPAKQWRPGRRDPPSGRGRILANSAVGS